MEIDIKTWLRTVKQFDTWFFRAAGRVDQIAKKLGKKWLAGKSGAKTAFT